jgi:hypothetical protein
VVATLLACTTQGGADETGTCGIDLEMMYNMCLEVFKIVNFLFKPRFLVLLQEVKTTKSIDHILHFSTSPI